MFALAGNNGDLGNIAYVDFGMMDSISEEDRLTLTGCLLYTSPSPRDVEESRMPSSA